MTKWKSTLISLAFIACGAAIMIAAHRMGVLGGSQDGAHQAQSAPGHDRDHDQNHSHDPGAADDHELADADGADGAGDVGHEHAARGGSALGSSSPRGTIEPEIVLTVNTDMPRSRRAPSPVCTVQQTLVQFADNAVAARAGLGLAAAQQREITQSLSCNAELVFNGDRFAHISPRAPGVVQRVDKSLGDRVNAGDVLAVIESADLGSAKAELLQALTAQDLWQQHYNRQRTLAESGVTAQRDLLEAENKLAEARIAVSRATQRLRNFGVSDERLEEIRHSGDTGSLLLVRAPFDGMIVERHAVLGEVVDSQHTIFSIADTSDMWAMLDVTEADARLVALGQQVTLQFPGFAGEPVFGTVTWISPQLDPQTRTLKVRAEVDNSAGHLRANMFGRAAIIVRNRQPMLVVPREAVQWEGCCNVVFVKNSETQYQPRKVRVGYEVDGWYAIEEGLEPGEQVVTRGSYLLKTEVLKGNIGAGCCADH